MYKIIISIICIFIITGCAVSNKTPKTEKGSSFSFEELQFAPEVAIPPLQFLQANDDVQLAYREYLPEKIDAILIFYHG